MAANKLILLPTDPLCPAINLERLASELQDIGLIGQPVKLQDRLFFPTGEHFLQLVTFLGCSPMIELDPPADSAHLEAASKAGTFCHIFLDGSNTLAFRADINCPEPRCPHCRQPVVDWPVRIREWQENPANPGWSCTACEYSGQLTDLVFRKTAGFGRTFVEIRGIYPSEAIPGDALFNTLEILGNGRWSCLYIKE